MDELSALHLIGIPMGPQWPLLPCRRCRASQMIGRVHLMDFKTLFTGLLIGSSMDIRKMRGRYTKGIPPFPMRK